MKISKLPFLGHQSTATKGENSFAGLQIPAGKELAMGQLQNESARFWTGDWRLGIAEERVAMAEERLARAEEQLARALEQERSAG